MENKEINSHFIQKAMAKRWAVNGKVMYSIHGTEENGSFDIEDLAKNQPIAEWKFYTYEVEKGINILESEGTSVVNKILNQQNNIILTRKEVIVIKFYLILNSIRTKLIRKNIENLNVGELLKIAIQNSNKTPQEIQELVMIILYKKYNEYKKNESSYFVKEKKDIENFVLNNINNPEPENKIYEEIKKQIDIEKAMKYLINSRVNSEIIFVKFDNYELLLTETNGFSEPKINKTISLKYDFFPLTPNIGVLLVPKTYYSKSSNLSEKELIDFSFDLYEIPAVKYVKQNQMFEAFKKFTKNSPIESEVDYNKQILKFDLYKRSKFYSKKDEFIYPIHFESKKLAIMCNGKTLVSCDNNSYVIYKSLNNYQNALQWIKKNNK